MLVVCNKLSYNKLVYTKLTSIELILDVTTLFSR